MQVTELAMKSWDGAEIFYRAWFPDRPTQKALLLFHRGHEHSGRWQETVEALKLNDVAVFAWDQRGHAENIGGVVKDAECFARHVYQTHGIDIRQTIVLAHSVGAVVAAAWVHDFAPPIRAMILGAPALRVKLYVPLAIPLLRLKNRVLGPGVVKSYVKAGMLTHDKRQAEAYQSDPLIFRQISVAMLLDLHDTSTRLLADAGAITVPTLILSAGTDWVVSIKAQQEFFRRLGSRIKQMDVYPGFYHAIFHETDSARIIERIRNFILASFARPNDVGSLLDANQGGFTRTEYDLLRGPGSVRWAMTRLALKTAGRLSEGIRLGWDSGFDSGGTLDYVYQNSPRGFGPLGRYIDHNYLNSIGWRGIRQRRENLQLALRQSMEVIHQSGRPVRILDIAAGAGRYVLETMRAASDIPSSAVLRDYQQVNLDAARKLAEQLGISQVQMIHGDAFDRASLASVEPRPTIAIVSGLYELFPENECVLRSLRGIADAMDAGGHLIYTCQPWHPQIEFIARVLTNREGRPWIMRRRTQAEMDELVRAAGFEKLSQEIDRWGIFTVSVARRLA